MKKIALLFTLTLVGAGALNGMENNPQPELSTFQNLPADVKNLIILAFAQSGNDLDTAIENIKIASRTNKALNNMINTNNIKGFTKIAYWLASKFNKRPIDIALKFKTPMSEKYVDLYARLEA
jgi:hypothetical protein